MKSHSLLRVAYLINQYPKVSHSFIRREIRALERQGFSVDRIALRGWKDYVVDLEDQEERKLTWYVLRDGIFPLIAAVFRILLQSPGRFLAALTLALHMARGALKPLPYHLIYLAEACRVLLRIQQHRVMHLHAHFGTNSAEVVMLVHVLGGPPYSFTVHGPEEFDSPEALGILEKIRRAAFVVAVNSYGRSQLYRWSYPEDWPKIKVVHCGINQTFYNVPLTPPPTEPRLVCVGRLCYQKGQLILVEAVARLVAKGIDCNVCLVGDGDIRNEIEIAIRQHKLEDRVRITGWVSGDEVRNEVLAARALVLPSLAEGLPVVIMEAMALRRPVIATFIAGIPELVRDGETGWLIPAGDVEALVTAIGHCVSRRSDELQVMGEAGYARVLQRHSVEGEAARLAEYFHSAASHPVAGKERPAYGVD